MGGVLQQAHPGHRILFPAGFSLTWRGHRYLGHRRLVRGQCQVSLAKPQFPPLYFHTKIHASILDKIFFLSALPGVTLQSNFLFLQVRTKTKATLYTCFLSKNVKIQLYAIPNHLAPRDLTPTCSILHSKRRFGFCVGDFLCCRM
jgi:hypothetical protein